VPELDVVSATLGGQRCEPRELLVGEHTVLPLQLRALAGQWQHAERELASDPAVVVAGERQCAAIADEVDDLGRRGRAEPDDVAQAPDLVGVGAVDLSENLAQRLDVAVDVGITATRITTPSRAARGIGAV
jgi:hypothetical protein